MATNGLKLLMGDYNSDSETDEEITKAETPPHSAKTDLNVAVDAFVSELQASATPPTTIVTSWTQCIDKATGHPYYWHPETKEVTWEIPAEYQKFLEQNAELLTSTNVASMWTVCLTDGEEPVQRYYVNEYTRIVSWDKPVGFVEPSTCQETKEASVKEDVPVSKNVIKRRKVQPKPKRENPYSKPTEAENEKIELISSFTAKSESSSEEEDTSNSKPLKLVATDYNSDTDNNTTLDTSGTICAIVPKTQKKLTDRSSSQPKDDAVVLPLAEPIEKSTKKKNTFASIITGGRSPEHLAEEGVIATADAVSEEATMQDSQRTDINVPTSIVKTQKRKRRIEFITKAPEVDDTDEKPAVCIKSVKNNTTEQNTKDMYANFKRSHVEFVDKKSTDNDADKKASSEGSRSSSKSPSIESGNSDELKNIIEAKLKFLCEGRPEVSAVQAILIQLETLLEAFDEGALQATYMQKWLESIATDLQTLEADAAPPGWKCLWNRDKSQYCYVHQQSGNVRWEYPTVETDDGAAPMSATAVAAAATEATTPAAAVPSTSSNNGVAKTAARHEDDEMDICTTPPPIADIASPKPPGTNEASEGHSITAELASFYSDLAAIETTVESASTTTTTTMCETVPDPIAEGLIVDGDEAAAVAKKKKRKIKKLQPWRSGNLETWINKWAKAQQELEN